MLGCEPDVVAVAAAVLLVGDGAVVGATAVSALSLLLELPRKNMTEKWRKTKAKLLLKSKMEIVIS